MALRKQSHPSHNVIFKNMKQGDLLQFKRNLYSHWAVVVDDEHVVHYAVDGDGDINFSGSVSGEEKAIIRKESYWNVVADSEVAINNELDKEHSHDSIAKIVKRALDSIGKKGYNLIWRNCEHFATWCRYEKEISKQVDRGLTSVTGAAVALGIGCLMCNALAFNEAERSKQNK